MDYTIGLVNDKIKVIFAFTEVRSDFEITVETPISWALQLWHQDTHYSYDLLLSLMPSFLKVRTLQVDEQILYENCNRLWAINTNDGLKYGKMLRFNSS